MPKFIAPGAKLVPLLMHAIPLIMLRDSHQPSSSAPTSASSTTLCRTKRNPSSRASWTNSRVEAVTIEDHHQDQKMKMKRTRMRNKKSSEVHSEADTTKEEVTMVADGDIKEDTTDHQESSLRRTNPTIPSSLVALQLRLTSPENSTKTMEDMEDTVKGTMAAKDLPDSSISSHSCS